MTAPRPSPPRRPPTMHGCAGCGRLIKLALFACVRDWTRLPKPYREALNSAYARRCRFPGDAGAVAAHDAAKVAATRWLRDNPRGTS